jgi:predicted nucleotidyltransferase
MEKLQKSYYKLLNMSRKIKTIEDLKEFLKKYFEKKQVNIYLFGSRARGDNSIYSDIDLAFESDENLSDYLAILEEILEESNLPYKVDIVNLKESSYLKEIINKV